MMRECAVHPPRPAPPRWRRAALIGRHPAGATRRDALRRTHIHRAGASGRWPLAGRLARGLAWWRGAPPSGRLATGSGLGEGCGAGTRFSLRWSGKVVTYEQEKVVVGVGEIQIGDATNKTPKCESKVGRARRHKFAAARHNARLAPRRAHRHGMPRRAAPYLCRKSRKPGCISDFRVVNFLFCPRGTTAGGDSVCRSCAPR